MKNENIDKEIKRDFLNKDGSFKKCHICKKYKHYKYILQRFDDSSSFSESVYRICKNIENRPVCPVCGGYLKYNKKSFSKHCSLKCSANDKHTREKCKQTCLKNYGKENPAQVDVVKEKMKETCLKKYGVEYSGQTGIVKLKRRKTWLEKYGSEEYLVSNDCKQKTKLWLHQYGNYINVFQVPHIKLKIKDSILTKYDGKYYVETDEYKNNLFKKYGVTHISKVKEVREKCKQTTLKHYGAKFYSQTADWKNKVIKTSLEKYNAKFPFQSEEIKNKIKKSNNEKYGVDYYSQYYEFKNKFKHTIFKHYGDYYVNTLEFKKYMDNIHDEVHNKIKKTCLEKYGVDSFSKTKLYKEKCYNTKKKNKTFNTSKQEEECFNIIKERYPNVIRQYRDSRYPYACDFYIPELDLFIELNTHWTHGGNPFIGSKEDLEKLEYWKNKHTKYYDIAIKVWTISDVNKRNMTYKNNLNYLEFWNVNEVEEWIKNKE